MPARWGVVGGRLATPPRTYTSVGSWYSNSVPAAASANTKGAWVQAIASLPQAVTAVNLNISGVGVSNSNRAALLDIGVGPSGSEVVVASNISVGMATMIEFLVPLAIPSGSRVAFRSQNATASGAMTVRSQFMTDGPLAFPPSSVDVLGTSTATSRGTLCATTGWTTIATTSVPYQAVVAVQSAGGTTSLAAVSGSSLVAYGDAGSEVQVNATYVVTTTSEAITAINGAGWDCGACPSGTRISGRRAGNTNIDVCIIGVPYA